MLDIFDAFKVIYFIALKASVKINNSLLQVEEFFDEFRCQCDAWSSKGLSSSRPATVAIGCKFS